MFDFLNVWLGWLMKFIYNLVSNYGVAIILFTVLTKILIFPLTLKQQKSSAQMQKIKPIIDEINKKYANDRQKLSEETMKVYQEYGISPTGGCLPLLIQLPIIFALYSVIQRPYTYIQGVSKETISAIKEALTAAGETIAKSISEIGLFDQAFSSEATIPALDGISKLNFNFLGLDLAKSPSQAGLISPMIIIPIVAAALTFLQSKLMYVGLSKEETELRKGKKADSNGRPPRPGEKKKENGALSGMTYFMPILTLLFTYNFAAGIGLYWIAGSVIQIVLTYVSNKFIIPRMKTKVKITSASVEAMRNKMKESNNNRPTARTGGTSHDNIEEIRKKLREKRKNS